MSAPFDFTATRPAPKELLREAPLIRRWLRRCGVPPVDLDDVTAEVIGAAWQAIDCGRFTPDPEMPPRTSLVVWLFAISWRQSNAALGRAYRRREVPFDTKTERRDVAIDSEAQIIARDELNLLGQLGIERRTVLIAHAAGCGIPEIAAAMGENTSTTWSRLRLGRLDLLEILRRRSARER